MRNCKPFFFFAALNFAFYLTVTFNPYITVYLQFIGFDERQIGLAAAFTAMVGMISVPLWGMASDKFRSIKGIIVLGLVLGGVFFMLIPLLGEVYIFNVAILFIFIPFVMFFRQPVMPLVDNWSIKSAREQGLNYGAIRAFGALGFAIMAFLLGYFAPRMEITSLFCINILFILPALILLLFARKMAAEKVEAEKRKPLTFKEMQFGQFFKNYHLVTYIIFTVFQRIPFQGTMLFFPFLIYAVGGDITQLGIILGVRAAAEIPVMLLLKPLRARFPLYILIIFATVLNITEIMLYAFVNDFFWLIVISVLHGVTNGIMIPAKASYIFSLAPEQLKATSQTVLASTNAIAGIVGSLAGGWLIFLVGIRNFYLITGLITAIFLILFALSFVFGEKVLKLKRPGLSLG
ncbi:MAG: MFS transporter [Defluviitaleaceae bacterium]|nr:MFS transporter [Defluviitaleaceae bacterium]MCL2275018.1 MFS transporter [Defluviitaleaceae bacterium]